MYNITGMRMIQVSWFMPKKQYLDESGIVHHAAPLFH